MNKKGTSLVELLAVIIIMGIVAGVATVSSITLINRQKKNMTVNTMNRIQQTAINCLNQVELGSYDDEIVVVDNTFCYVSLTSMIDGGIIDGDNFKPIGSEVYFCHDVDSFWAVISDDIPNKEKPSSSGTTSINAIDVTYNYSTLKFKAA